MGGLIKNQLFKKILAQLWQISARLRLIFEKFPDIGGELQPPAPVSYAYASMYSYVQHSPQISNF